jgi:hypothetical protein
VAFVTLAKIDIVLDMLKSKLITFWGRFKIGQIGSALRGALKTGKWVVL